MADTPDYWQYLKLDRLLSLQGGLDDDEATVSADELHFIVVHQVYELWFKVVLREVRLARDLLGAEDVPEDDVPLAVRHLGRAIEVLHLAIAQWRVLETLAPQDFLAFRDKLVPASGFQSFQMRELEILLGLEARARYAYGEAEALEHIRRLAAEAPGGETAWRRIETAKAEESLKAALSRWLSRAPIRGSVPGDPGDEETVLAFVQDYLDAVERHHAAQAESLAAAHDTTPGAMRDRFAALAAASREFLLAADYPEEERNAARRTRAGILFVESYRDLPLLAWPRTLLDRVVELEQQLVVWRIRHARMVERIIGRRVGTGGSSGVDYLDRTTGYRIFTDLWTIRSMLLPRELLPPLDGAGSYGFARR